MRSDEMPDSIPRAEKEETTECRNVFLEWVDGETDELDEKSIYAVNAKSFKGNPIHAAILQTGFNNGAYSALLSQGDTYNPHKYVHIEVVEKLTEMPNHGPFPHRGDYNE